MSTGEGEKDTVSGYGQNDGVCVCLCLCVILTLAGLAVLSRGEAHLTLAAVATRSVQTLAVLTQVHVVSTLIHIRTGEAIPIEALLAGTAVGAWGVDTVCVEVAVVLLSGTLIHVYGEREGSNKRGGHSQGQSLPMETLEKLGSSAFLKGTSAYFSPRRLWDSN